MCFHCGWDGEGSDLPATLVSPKVYALGSTWLLHFPILSGPFCRPYESAWSRAFPSQMLQALAVVWFGAMTVPFPVGMWSNCSLGPWLLLSPAFLPSGLTDLGLSQWVAFHSTSIELQANHTPCSQASHAGLPPRGGTPGFRDKDGAGSLLEPHMIACNRMPGFRHPSKLLTAMPIWASHSPHLAFLIFATVMIMYVLSNPREN